MTKKDYLNTLHTTLLEILDVVVEICERHGLTYFLAYGTCIGAVRHQGFIPWDDDIDIGMPRADYDRFIETCKSELPEGYYFQGLENEKHYWLAFSKIRKSGTQFIESYAPSQLPPEKQGVYIDVFPYEGISAWTRGNAGKDYIIRKLRVALFLKTAQQRDDADCGFAKYILSKALPWSAMNFWVRCLSESMNGKNPQLYVSAAQMQPPASGALKAENGRIPVMKTAFEGREFCIPRDYDEYLKSLYGDYMQLPPEDQRRTHAPVKVDFGDGVITLEPD